MARLGGINNQANRLTFTMCPGAQVYMPPEAIKEKPVYTEKVDCFSFGVIIVQILSRKFPAPEDRFKPIEDSQMGQNIVVIVPEVEWRQNHIHEVDHTNHLLPIAISCLQDIDMNRPSSQQICERISDLKESQEFAKSSTCDPKAQRILELEEQIKSLQETVQLHRKRLKQKDRTILESEQQIENLQEEVQLHRSKLEHRNRTILELEQQIKNLQEAVQLHRNRLEQKDRTITMLMPQIPTYTDEEKSR